MENNHGNRKNRGSHVRSSKTPSRTTKDYIYGNIEETGLNKEKYGGRHSLDTDRSGEIVTCLKENPCSPIRKGVTIINVTYS